MADLTSKKWSYLFLLVSVALLAMNFPFATFNRIEIPDTSILIPANFLWCGFAFLIIPFVNEIRESHLQLGNKIDKQFKTYLTKWSQKKKDQQHRDLHTPQYLLIKSGFLKLKIECKYCQVGPRLEPSFSAISNPLHSLLLLMKAFVKIMFLFDLLDRITLPSISAGVAVVMKIYRISQAI